MQRHECMPILLNISELDYVPVYLNKHYCGLFGEQMFHYHKFIEVCYVVSGGGYHQIRDKVLKCKKGDIYILNTGVAHAFFMSSDFKYSELLVKNLIFLPCVIYSNDCAGSDLIDVYHHLSTQILSDDTSVIKLTLNGRQFDIIERMYNDIESEFNEHENGYLAVVNAEITTFMVRLARYLKENADSVIPYRYSNSGLSLVEGTCEYIQKNFRQNTITITTAAEYVYTSKSYLSRLFKKYTGKYFSDYLLKTRLNEACRLLCETTMTNEQVITACGFRDLPTFYKNFKNQIGTTPKQYVNMFRNNNYHKNEGYMAINTTQMDSTERVRRAILGQPVDRTPIYGWLSANLSEPINRAYGSVTEFEDKYEFDAAHIFGGPNPFNDHVLNKLRAKNDELTPDLLLDADIFTSSDIIGTYGNIRNAIDFYKKRGRFCYVQTPGFFENFNDVFGIENQLAYIAEYPEELGELYRRQAQWTLGFADRCIEYGADMIHISDDWGAQNNLMFSPNIWRRLIKPNLKTVIDYVHSRKILVSLHSDGCVAPLAGEIAELGIDCVHPWQESAHMPYSLWLENYSELYAILGGICVQTTLGFGNTERLESEIRRIFGLLKDKRWICCTTHFVQDHCSIPELAFAYDLIYKLSREQKN